MSESTNAHTHTHTHTQLSKEGDSKNEKREKKKLTEEEKAEKKAETLEARRRLKEAGLLEEEAEVSDGEGGVCAHSDEEDENEEAVRAEMSGFLDEDGDNTPLDFHTQGDIRELINKHLDEDADNFYKENFTKQGREKKRMQQKKDQLAFLDDLDDENMTEEMKLRILKRLHKNNAEVVDSDSDYSSDESEVQDSDDEDENVDDTNDERFDFNFKNDGVKQKPQNHTHRTVTVPQNVPKMFQNHNNVNDDKLRELKEQIGGVKAHFGLDRRMGVAMKQFGSVSYTSVGASRLTGTAKNVFLQDTPVKSKRKRKNKNKNTDGDSEGESGESADVSASPKRRKYDV